MSIIEFDNQIALIGMSGRFPGANNVDEFWSNLCQGMETISFFSDEELSSLGISSTLLNNPHYVKAKGILDHIDKFDASFFGISPKEAMLIDPQQRVFLECAWEALENAGYDPEAYSGLIGIYAGVSMNNYLFNLLTHPGVADIYNLQLASDKDYVATRVSYKLNLRGPSITVQTACSTSLTAVHLACQSLLNGECDIALAGGVTITLPQKSGYIYQEEASLSPDGHCRAFDRQARGTVPANGVGIVVLKRLENALADRDHIFAVIRGSALNNDGSHKVGFTAPGVEGQARVIAEALALAEVSADTLTYVETHGTGTLLGDPIEITALTQVFRTFSTRKHFCAIGSVKTNIGHVDTVAGVAGLIKTALALKHKILPPSLHFEEASPNIDFASSPFYVNTHLQEWAEGPTPRRAGVSSFGLGGTNVHVILEEAPSPIKEVSEATRPLQIILLSAKTESALEQATDNLATHLTSHPHLNLADIAFTSQSGRRAFTYRRVLIARDVAALQRLVDTHPAEQMLTAHHEGNAPSVVFMFSGGGSQYPGMGADHYQIEPVFRQQMDHCADILKPLLHLDIRDVLYTHGTEGKEEQLQTTAIALTSLFATSYAMAKLWMSWGVQPEAMIGHSLGEYVAACLAGVFSLKDALSLIVLRGQLLDRLSTGAMLSILSPLDEIEYLLDEQISVAALNGPAHCVVSGPSDAIEALIKVLAVQQIAYRRILINVGGHSALVEPILETFHQFIQQCTLHAPVIPYISNVSGTWIKAEEATNPSYWVSHLRQTVRFSDGVQVLASRKNQLFLEVSPSQTVSTLVKLQVDDTLKRLVFSSMRHPHDPQTDTAFLLTTVGKLWLAGISIDWSRFQQAGRRIPLPTYPFERQRFWIDGQKSSQAQRETKEKRVIKDWFYIPSWKRTLAPVFQAERLKSNAQTWLVFADKEGVGLAMVEQITRAGQQVIVVWEGEGFSCLDENHYTLRSDSSSDYRRLFDAIHVDAIQTLTILHLWSIYFYETDQPLRTVLSMAAESGFYSLLFLAKALDELNYKKTLPLWVISNEAEQVNSNDMLRPEKALSLGPCKILPQEFAHITCRFIDVVLPPYSPDRNVAIAEQLLAECQEITNDAVVAYRGSQRWARVYEPVHIYGTGSPVRSFREKGVYLITGGMGNVGLQLAEYLAQTFQAKLVLISRSPFLVHTEWQSWLDTHDDTDTTSQKIRHLQSLEQVGAEIMIASADVADQAQLRLVVDQVIEQFGCIHGVIHASLSGDIFSPVHETDRQGSEKQFHSKVSALYTLEEVMRTQQLDFVVLLSSNAAILGGVGFFAYASVNSFLDAFARSRNTENGTYWVSTNWDSWPFLHNVGTKAQTSIDQYTMTRQEGADAFVHAVTMTKEAQVIISCGDLAVRLHQWIDKPLTLHANVEAAEIRQAQLDLRSNTAETYVAPRNDLEQCIAEIWQDLLGIKHIGIHENFFELGGNSLLGVQVFSRLRDALQLDIPLRSLFLAPTIAMLSLLCLQTQAEDIEDETLIQLLTEVEHLPDD